MKSLQKRIRSTATGALLMSLTTLALAPELVFCQMRADGSATAPLAIAIAPPKPLTAPKLLAFDLSTWDGAAEHEAEAADLAVDADNGFADEPKAYADGGRPFSTPSPFTLPLVSGSARKILVDAIVHSDFAIATVAQAKQTFTPRNDKPAQVADNESIDSDPEPLPPVISPDEAGNQPTELASTNTTRLPHAYVPEPSALWLLGAGIVGLVICRRQKI